MSVPATLSRRILACDDELQILRALRLTLRPAGYEVVTTATMEEALDALALNQFDAAILDLLLPDGDGVGLTERIREWSELPVIVLSAVGEEEQKVRALRAGADDYITKPFGPDELMARLEAVLRRAGAQTEEAAIAVAGLEIDMIAHTVRRDGEEIHLTRTEFDLLRLLMRHRGRLLTHRLLLAEVWGAAYVEDIAVLRTHLARLRSKIEPASGPRRHYIRTEPGVGYRFEPK
jgi:two-component system, OmpR family, KDP operon response regulator KdpE